MLVVFLSNNLKRIEIVSLLFLIPVIGYHLLLNTQFEQLHAILSNYLPLLNHFPLFFAGILFYKIKFNEVGWIQHVLIVFCFILQYVLFFDGGKSHYFISQPEYGSMLLFYWSLFILYTGNHLKFIVNKVTLFLGDISYSLYLLHTYIGRDLIVPGLVKYAGFNFWVAVFGFALPSVLVISAFVSKYLEKPLMSYIRVQYKKRIISE
jgi:peptidoglycan/LPS O-acetylase OafA/YrhL